LGDELSGAAKTATTSEAGSTPMTRKKEGRTEQDLEQWKGWRRERRARRKRKEKDSEETDRQILEGERRNSDRRRLAGEADTFVLVPVFMLVGHDNIC